MTPRAAAMSPDERREAIVAAVTPLVLDRGGDVTSRDLATAAGVSEGTVFKVFESKDAVIDAVVAALVDPSSTLEELAGLRADDLADAVGQITALLHRRLDAIVSLFSVLHARARQHPGSDRSPEEHREHTRRLMAALTTALEPFADELRVPPATAASVVRATAFATGHPLLSDGLLSDPAEVAELLLHGISRPEKRTPSC